MTGNRYVLVTPARNEAGTIEQTLQSVVRQTILPREWIIVNDGSTDDTAEIVGRYARSHPFLRLLDLQERPARDFASAVFATEAGLSALETADYDYVGLLDADVRFAENYFDAVMARFAADPQLGLGGGFVRDIGSDSVQSRYSDDVAGAVQFFRRECFQSLGGLIAIPEGGWDALTNFQARANGYTTRTFSDIIVDHLKPRNSAAGGLVRRSWQFGRRDYALGYGLAFETAKCLSRLGQRPRLAGAALQWAGFCWNLLLRPGRALPSSLVTAIRREQRRRLLAALLGSSK